MTGMEFSAETWAVKSFIRCCRWPGRMRTLALCQACPAPGVQLPRGTAPHRSRRAVIRRAAGPDVVVIGSGIGGLTAGALCAKYGMSVTVLESHSIPGGAAHSWVHPKGYHFESGPSLYSGMASRGRAANPLAHVLQALGEPLELIRYKTWNVIVPEGEFLTEVGAKQFLDVIQRIQGPAAVHEWRALQEHMRPLARAATMVPPTAIRADAGVVLTALGRYLPEIVASGPSAGKLAGPFSEAIRGVVTDRFLLNWLDLLCFLLSGLPANGTIAAEVAFMFNEWYKPESFLEYPKGGSGALVQALVRGLERHGGRLELNSHVESVLVEGGRAVGVRLRGGREVRANKAVISNATLWDLAKMVPPDLAPKFAGAKSLPPIHSFMHLHLGFDATGLPDDLQMHHIVVNDWDRGVAAEQNVVLVSIPSVEDPSLAPAGRHVLHAYTPATEPYALWEGLDRSSPAYRDLKAQRSEVLWRAVERVIADIRTRVDVSLVGTPLTHERFLRRHRGSYGPGLVAGQGVLPGCKTPIRDLLLCGDTAFPGIGLPAVAASGAIAANTLVGVPQHLALLDELGL